MEKNEIIQIIGTTTQELLGRMSITAKVGVSQETDEKKEIYYKIEIEGEDLGVIIGYHGERLLQLQYILNVIMNKKLQIRVKIIIDINKWREQRKEALEKLAKHAIQKLYSTKNVQVLPAMSAYERKIIHMIVANEKNIKSHSEGENENRKVIIEFDENSE